MIFMSQNFAIAFSPSLFQDCERNQILTFLLLVITQRTLDTSFFISFFLPKKGIQESQRKMIFFSLRWLITTAMYNAALLYAAYLAMRPTNTDAPSSPAITGKEKLKLWMILATVTAVSDTFGYNICSWIPLFYELRCIFVWCLILLEPTAWCRFYDVVLSPTALKLLSTFQDLKSSMVVRRGVHTAVTCASSLFIVLLEVAISTGALDKATADLEDTILPWHERMTRFDVTSVSSASLRASVADLNVTDRTLEDTTSIGDEMRTLSQRTIDKNKLAFVSADLAVSE